jgi:hypothetical protein
MIYFSRRLPHVLTRPDLAQLLTPTYAEAVGVDEDEALERMQAAVERQAIVDDLYVSVSSALAAVQGTRSEDEIMNKLSQGVQKRLGRMKPAPVTMALSALMVRVNIELGHAPESLRATLETDKGRALLATGLKEIGEFLVGATLRKQS